MYNLPYWLIGIASRFYILSLKHASYEVLSLMPNTLNAGNSNVNHN